MAENPIRKQDIIDADEIKRSVNELIATLGELSKVAHKDLKASADAVAKSLQGVTVASEEGRKNIADAAKQTGDMVVEQKRLLAIDKSLAEAKTKFNSLQKESTQEKIRETDQVKRAIKEKEREVLQGKAAADSYVVMTKRLKELRDAWRMASEEGRKSLGPQISKIDNELKKLDKTVGQHQREVGNYGIALKDAGAKLADMARGAVGAAAIIGALTTVVKGVKEAIMSTTFAIDTANIVGEVWKQVLFDISVNGGIAIDSIKGVISIQKELNELRHEARLYSVDDAKMSRDMAALRLLAADATADESARLAALTKVREVDADQTRQRLMLLAKELKSTMDLLALRPANEKLLIKQAELMSRIYREQEQSDTAMRRVESQRTGIIKKQLSDRAALMDAWHKEIEADNKVHLDKLAADEKAAEDARQKVIDDRIKAATAAREATSRDATKRMQEHYKTLDASIIQGAQLTSTTLVDVKRAEIEETQEMVAANAEFEKEINREILRDKVAAMEGTLQMISDLTNAMSDIFMSQKNRELSAAGDNAEKREEIERKYFRKQQTLAVGQAIINGALAITKVTAQTGVLAPLAIPIIIAATAAQIGLILSQKFAEGGFTGKGSYRDETGERVAGIVHENEFVINKENTRKYRPLIEAIHNDDPAKIAEIVANTNMHHIWGDMNKSMAGMTRQDPYTRLMYEVLKANVVSYIDSDGNTVLMQNGRKQVIKRKE